MSLKQFAQFFSGLTVINKTFQKAVTDMIIEQGKMNEMFEKLESINISSTAGQKVLKFAQEKYAETPFKFNSVNILDRLFIHGLSGLNEENAILYTKYDILIDIRDKKRLQKIGKIYRGF